MENTNGEFTNERLTRSKAEELLNTMCAQEQFYSTAVFDILGFSNYVEKNGNQAVLDLYNKLLTLVYKPDDEKYVPVRLTDDWKYNVYLANSNGYVRACHFSDTIIIYVNYLVHGEPYLLATRHYEPYPLLLGKNGELCCAEFYIQHPIYLSFLQTCMDFFIYATMLGIPLRGCISSGFATMDSNKSIYFGKPLVEAARGEPARKMLGISFGRSFNNHHPVYNDYFIPYWSYIKEDKSRFLSPMVLDWPRCLRNSLNFKKDHFYEWIKKMNIDPDYSEYYNNTIRFFDFSSEHTNWPEEINRDGIEDILDYYQKTKIWYESVT